MPGWSSWALRALREKLAALYDTGDAQKMFLRDLGLTPVQIGSIALHPAPIYSWFKILEWAEARGDLLDRLVARLRVENPDDVEIRAIAPDMPAPPAMSTGWDAGEWKGDRGLERILPTTPTLVPVHWLTRGLACARSVGRVNLADRYGTGFLIRGKSGDLLLTNHHVLETPEVAASATVSFNFEERPGGLAAEVDVWELDASRFWTSPVKSGDDWTAVGVRSRDGAGATVRATDLYGALDITPIDVRENERVNIIQHPGGRAKQLSCVSNIVAWVGEGRVHYLTDTQPGSSGAPVFNRDWRVVALHHSGQSTLSSTPPASRYQRNEGIAVARVHEGLVAAGAL